MKYKNENVQKLAFITTIPSVRIFNYENKSRKSFTKQKRVVLMTKKSLELLGFMWATQSV